MYEHATSKFLLKDKKGMDLNSFKEKFYRSVKLNNQRFEEEQFDDLLAELFIKEPEVYAEWYKVFLKIPYVFLAKNTVLMTNLVSLNNPEYVIIAYEMEKKRKSLISRCIPAKANTSTVAEAKKLLYTKLAMQLVLLESDSKDSILSKVKDEFYLSFGKYENDRFLGDVYNNILNNFENDISKALITEIDKINRISAKLVNTDNIGFIVDSSNAAKKEKNLTKAYRKY